MDLFDRTFDAVIFDMDETLIASGKATVRCWTQWAIRYGVTAEQLAGCQGMPSRQVVEAVIAPELVDEAAAHIEALELADFDDITPLPGALRAFTELPLDRVGIATSCTQALMQVRMRQTGLPTPGALVWRELVRRGKPAPDSFLLAANMLGVDPARTLVVEDAPAGVAAGKAAGASTLGVLTTTAASDLPADVIVRNLDDVTWLLTDAGITVRQREATSQ